MTDLDFPCDWDELCTAVFATRSELAEHDRGHWDAEDALNAQLRSNGSATQTGDTEGR